MPLSLTSFRGAARAFAFGLLTTGSMLAALSPAPAIAGQTDNFGLHAVPPPGKVQIDGKLDDWDLSGSILICYDLSTLQDVYSAKVSTMYDAEYVYVALRWKDPVPMGNRHDPLFEANKAWAGDCVQLRFKTDRIAHVTAWYYPPRDEPAIEITYGKDAAKPMGGGSVILSRAEPGTWKLSDGAEMAFRRDEDGKGYVQEIKLPWKLVSSDPQYAMRPGSELSMGVDLLWGEADWPVHRYADNVTSATADRIFFFRGVKDWGRLLLEPRGKLTLPEPGYMVAYRKEAEGEKLRGPVKVTYSLPQDARVTLAIDDKDGRRVRNLISALPRKAGANTELWDGMDDNGKPVEPGEYKLKILSHNGIHAQYVMSFACPGSPTWETASGRGGFYGNHTPPEAAAAGGQYVALACPIGEGAKHLIGVDLEGRKLWGLNNREFNHGGRISLATDGRILWVANEANRSTIYRVEIANGKYAPWKTEAAKPGEKPPLLVDLQVADTPEPTPAPGSADKAKDARQSPPLNLVAIAHHNGDIAACFQRENQVRILDGETGAVKARFTVDAPQAVTYAGDGWLVLSAGKLLRLSPDGKTAPFIAGTGAGDNVFPAGYGLAADAEGNVYLSVRGADQNVKVFSPQGRLLWEIGERGGRPLCGKYNARAMRNPAQITIDSSGRLWVTESTMNPKRTSVWDAKTGALLKDLAGTTSYAGAGAIVPHDPTVAYSDSTLYSVNLETGASEPAYSFGPSDNPADLFPPRVVSLSRAIQRGKDTYIYTAMWGMQMRCLIGRDGEWRSTAAMGFVPAQPRKEREDVDYSKSPFVENAGKFFAWADQNGDGLVQDKELVFAALQIDGKPAVKLNSYWGYMPDKEGTMPCLVAGANAVFKFPIKGTTACGAPIYDVANPEIVRPDIADVLGKSIGGMVSGGGDGRVYVNMSPLTALGRDGRVLGTYPSRHVSVHGSHTAGAAKPGFLIGPSSILGVEDFGGDAGELFMMNGNLGETYLFTKDAMWVQSVFKDTRGMYEIPEKAVRGMPMDGTTAGGESFGGHFTKVNGKAYLTIGSADVLELTGLDSIRRSTGTITYTKEQYVEAQTLSRDLAAEANKPKVYAVAKADAPPVIDGKPDEWPELTAKGKEQPIVEIQEGADADTAKVFARTQVRYDEQNLYVAWRVLASRPQMKNAGQDYRLLFKTGDVVDVMLGPDPQIKTGEGNLRVVISPMSTSGDNLTAVLNQKTVPGAKKEEGFLFAAPWRSFHFDRVVQAPEVMAAQGKITGGYFVEAAIPWKLLGIQPKPGLKLKADFGALFADGSGALTVARKYWSNKATGLVNDIPGEADLEPRFWGTIELK